jgi:hypothetical protein
VAKGVETDDRAYLQHENLMYDQLRAIQGKYVPVCLGSIDLLRPHHYDGRIHAFLVPRLGWTALVRLSRPGQSSAARPRGRDDIKEIHRLSVLHRDAEPRNILYEGGTLMVVDFERAEFRGRQPLSSIVANVQTRKRKRGKWRKQVKDDFASELESAVEKASRCIAKPTPSRSLM